MESVHLVDYASAFAIAIIATAVAVLLISQRDRIGRFALRFGENKEIEFELSELVQAEVDKAKCRSLKELVALDMKLIPLWERRGFRSPIDSKQKLEAIAAHVEAIENQLEHATTSDAIDYRSVLRELYWHWLEQAREQFASSDDYKQIRNHIMTRLQESQRLASHLISQ